MKTETAQKHVLIVDDETDFLLSLVDGLSGHLEHFKVHTAGNGRQAIEVLDSNQIDLVVTDLKMPEMDGFELLAHLSQREQRMPVVVMTAFGTPETERQVRDLGVIQYLEKPIELDQLAETIINLLEAGPHSFIRGITLPAFMQLVEMERKSCTLTVRSGTMSGWLFFNNGALIDAETAKHHGAEAAYEIICWEGCEIEVSGAVTNRKLTIEMQLPEVLMEAHRLLDERRREQEEGERSDDMVALRRESTDVLDDLLKIPDVNAAVVVGRDGFVIESVGSSSGVSLDNLGASLAHAINGIEEMGSELEVLGFQDLFVEFGKAVIMCRPAGDAVVAVVAPDASKLGIIRHKSKKLVEELADFF